MTEHPAMTAANMRKEGGFWAVLPWLLMAAPFATQLIDRFRGGAGGAGGAGGVGGVGDQDPFAQLQVQPRPKPQPKSDADEHEPHLPPALVRTAQGLHRYRAGY